MTWDNVIGFFAWALIILPVGTFVFLLSCFVLHYSKYIKKRIKNVTNLNLKRKKYCNINLYVMKYILLPLIKYSFSTLFMLWVLFLTLLFYPIIMLWEFKLMNWNEYLVYNYSTRILMPNKEIITILENESFKDTIIRWVKFKYTIMLLDLDEYKRSLKKRK